VIAALPSSAAPDRDPARLLQQRELSIYGPLRNLAPLGDLADARIATAEFDIQMQPDPDSDARGNMRQFGLQDGAKPVVAL